MRKIIEELWYGNIDFCSVNIRPTQKEKEVNGYISRHREELLKTLTVEEKSIFEKFVDCSDELKEFNKKEIFEYAFCLGARIAIEIMNFKAD